MEGNKAVTIEGVSFMLHQNESLAQHQQGHETQRHESNATGSLVEASTSAKIDPFVVLEWNDFNKLRKPFLATASSVGVAVIMGLIGFLLQKQGVLSPAVRKGAAETVSRALLPALLFTSILECPPCDYWKAHLPPEKGGCFRCRDVSDKLISAVYVIVWPLITTTIGLLLGRLVTEVFHVQDDFRGGVIGSITFCNNTAMPSVVLLVIYTRLTSMGIDSLAEPLQYHAFYLLLTPLLQATVGARLFGVGQPKFQVATPEKEIKRSENEIKSHAVEGKDPAALSKAVHANVGPEAIASEENCEEKNAAASNERDTEPYTRSMEDDKKEALEAEELALAKSFRESFKRLVVETFQWDGEARSTRLTIHEKRRMTVNLFGLADAGELQASDDSANNSETASAAEVPSALQALSNYLQPVTQGPIIAILLAILVGLIKPVRGLLVDVHSTGHAPPLHWVYLGLQRMGMSTLPTNMLILGASLADSPGVFALRLKIQLAIVMCRMVAVPAITWYLIRWLDAYIPNMDISSQRQRGAVLLVLFGNSCFPTANNMSVLAQLGNQNRDCLAATILFQYMIAPFLIILWFSTFIGYVLI